MEKQLPNSVIAQLFKNNLVLVEKSASKIRKSASEGKENNESESTLPEIWWLGKNNKKVAIVLKDADNKFISDKNLTFLITILNACKLSADDIAIINLDKTKVDFEMLKQKLSAEVIILFGVNFSEIKIKSNAEKYVIETQQNTQIISAATFEKLNGNAAENKTEKANLWNALKKIFNL